MLTVDHQQAPFHVSVMSQPYPHNNSFDPIMPVGVDKCQSTIDSISPPNSASSASSHSQLLFPAEQDDFSQQTNPFSHHPPPQPFPDVHHPTPSHTNNMDHSLSITSVQLKSSIGPSRVLTRRQARAQQHLSQTSVDVTTNDNNLSSQTPHGNTLSEGYLLYPDPIRPETPIRLSPTPLNHPHDQRPHLTDLSIGPAMLSLQSSMASPPNPPTPASSASSSNYSHYGFHPYANHSRSASSSTNHRSASPAVSVVSAATSLSSSSSSRRQIPFNAPPLSPPASKPKKRLYNKERKAICLYSQKHPNARQEDIAAAYGVERSTVSKILKHKTKWLAISEGEDNQVAKHRPSKFPDIESHMVGWLNQCRDTKTLISDVMIRTKAKEAAKVLMIGEDKFKASAGWVENFKHRHNIKKGVWIGKPAPPAPSVDMNTFPNAYNPLPFMATGAGNDAHTGLGDIVQDDAFGQSPQENIVPQVPDSLSDGSVYLPPKSTGILVNGENIVGAYGPGWNTYMTPPTNNEPQLIRDAYAGMKKVMTYIRSQQDGFLADEELRSLASIQHLLSLTASGIENK